MLTAARNSLVIGVVASLVSTVLRTMAGYAVHRYKLRVLPFLVLAPIAIPRSDGREPLIFFVAINLTLGLISIALAHIAFCIGFVAHRRARAPGGHGREPGGGCARSGGDAGTGVSSGDPAMIMPGVVAGALMAFTLSIDDFVITYFTAGAGAMTLPLVIYTMVKITVTPEVNAVSTLLMG